MYSSGIREKAISLRMAGFSYSYISKKIGIRKSTLSEWLSKIPYNPNDFTLKFIGSARIASAKTKRAVKIKSLEEAEKQAYKDVGELSKRDLFMIGLGVYIGEGTKTFDSTRIINANPKVIKLTIRWLEEVCGVPRKNMRIRLYLYPDNNEKTSVKFWSDVVGIPIQRFYKSIVDKRSDKRKDKRGKLPNGTAHLSVVSMGDKRLGVSLHRLIKAWMDMVLC